MAITIVQLGAPRAANEGVRIGTVRRPPRGVPREKYAADDWYDVWLPNLSPSQELMSTGRAAKTEGEWNSFAKKFKAEMTRPDASHLLDTLAALSHTSSFAVGCYCDDESRCHRSLLRSLLEERGAAMA